VVFFPPCVPRASRGHSHNAVSVQNFDNEYPPRYFSPIRNTSGCRLEANYWKPKGTLEASENGILTLTKLSYTGSSMSKLHIAFLLFSGTVPAALDPLHLLR